MRRRIAVGDTWLGASEDYEQRMRWRFDVVACLSHGGRNYWIAVKSQLPPGSLYTHVFDDTGQEVESAGDRGFYLTRKVKETRMKDR